MKTLKARARAVILWTLCGFSSLLQVECLATESVTLAWDPSPDPEVLGYNIYYGPSTGAYTNKASLGAVTNAVISGLVEGATYYFTATAYDRLGLESEFSNEVSYSVPMPATNAPPTLAPLGDLVIDENAGVQTVSLAGISSGTANKNQALSITAISSNPALIPNPLVSYTSPNSTGTLTFTPSHDVFGAARITVLVDNGQPTQNLVSRSFTVTVRGTVAQVSLGQTIVQTGQSGAVGVDFGSVNGLRALDLLISQPPGLLTNFTLQALAPEIDPGATSCALLEDSSLRLHLAARPGQVMIGTSRLAELAFTAPTGQHAAFVPLQLLEIVGTETAGSVVTNRFGQSGRVVVVGPEALLESGRDANAARILTLYGLPHSSYAIEYSADLSRWTRLPNVITLEDYTTTLTGLDTTQPNIYYRAVEVELSTGP